MFHLEDSFDGERSNLYFPLTLIDIVFLTLKLQMGNMWLLYIFVNSCDGPDGNGCDGS